MSTTMKDMPLLLQVNDLNVQFHTDRGVVKAVSNTSYHIVEEEIVGVVGESGCGKSVTQLSVMGLIPTPPGEIVNGEVVFEGRDLLKYKSNDPHMLAVRGGKIAMVFQEPMTSLNPVLTIERQMTEAMQLHLSMSKKEATARATELLDMAGIPDSKKRLKDYPYQFSGGMRQRVMIAMALSCNPRIIIGDEPTTALDVTTQAQLLELMVDMVTDFKASLILVTHNLGVVARYVQRLYVMYAGHIVESGTSKEIFGNPLHPYTEALLQCVPRLDEAVGKKLVPIVGMPPNLINLPSRCAFQPRCKHQLERCKFEPWPELVKKDGQHYVSCYAR